MNVLHSLLKMNVVKGSQEECICGSTFLFDVEPRSSSRHTTFLVMFTTRSMYRKQSRQHVLPIMEENNDSSIHH